MSTTRTLVRPALPTQAEIDRLVAKGRVERAQAFRAAVASLVGNANEVEPARVPAASMVRA
ncbi:MAG: hypothetical protein ACFCUN_03030 [Hyphomicrobiaceae bacterium]